MKKGENKRGIFREGCKLAAYFWPEVRRQGKLLALSAFAVLLTVALRTLEPWPLKFIYDGFFGAVKGGGYWRGLHIPDILRLQHPEALLFLLAASILAISVLGSLSDYFGSVMMTRAASRIIARIRHTVFWSIAHQSQAFHGRHKTGDLVARVTYDIDRLREATVTAALPLVTNILTLAAMLVVMFLMNWRLAVCALLAFPVFALSVSRLTGRIREVSRTQRGREGVIASTAAETIASIRVVQAFSLQKHFVDGFSAVNTASFEDGARAQQLTSGLERTVEVLVAAATAVVLFLGARMVMDRSLTPGDLVVFVNYLRTAFRPMRQLAKYAGQIAKAIASGERILELTRSAPEIQDREGARSAGRFRGQIRFQQVWCEYVPGRPVLRGVTFEARPGQRIAVVGPSGSGKSTLASLLLRMLDPVRGAVSIDGMDIRELKLESVRSQVAIVLQENPLFAVSIWQNIAYGRAEASMEEIIEAAKLANAHEFIQTLPQGYDTVLGERGATLSGGQRQRIAIARAVVRRAPIMIFDEPLTGLDAESEREVIAGIENASRGQTSILIAHDLTSVMHCDHVIYLAGGEIVEAGKPEELMARRGEFWRAYSARSGAVQVPSAASSDAAALAGVR